VNSRFRNVFLSVALIGAIVLLCVIFPRALAFVEMAAREFRYFWWLILLLALAIWLIWGVGRRPKG
jgi:hypothetical protein